MKKILYCTKKKKILVLFYEKKSDYIHKKFIARE